MVSPNHLREDRVFDMTRDELDALPYGVITLDRLGMILRYNYAEASFARRVNERNLGLAFFTDVAPCTNVKDFKGRFDRFSRQYDSGVERFDFTFAFRWGSQDVSITLLRRADHDEINLIVLGRTQAALDIAPVPSSEGIAVSAERGPPPGVAPASFSNDTREVDTPISWEVGSPEEAAWRAKVYPEDALPTQRIIDSALARRRPYGIEYRVVAENGQQRVVQEHGSFASGKDPHGYATIVDVTEQRRQENRLSRLARYDLLTGLPNRALLLERIAAAAAEVAAGSRVSAVLALAITRFQSVSETFGHATGNELLRQVALRLCETIRSRDTVAHLEGEVFVVLLTAYDDVADVTARARVILDGFSRTFDIDARSYKLSANLGISLTPRNGTNPDALLQAAETAMFAAQNEAQSGIVWFSTDMLADVERNLRTEDELRSALNNGEFVLNYQPIVQIEDGRTVAVEALVRWNHPSRGLLMPAEFIGVAERSGLIAGLGEWVMLEACRQARRWHDLGHDLRVCVNLSIVQFRQPNLVAFVASTLAETALPPRMLELELTESVMIDGFSQVIDTLSRLKLTGVRLAIDDFGTGYSSLSYLKYFPVDTLKIDRAFVADIVSDVYDRAIVKAVLALASELEIDCIAEGVETKEQLESVRRLGAGFVQGYYFSRPVLPAALDDRLFASRTVSGPA